jgi:acetylornithine deacetylase/succinyl-diaminopimelate desuccinylase-like protein
MRGLIPALAAALASCATVPAPKEDPPSPAQKILDDVDWNKAGDEAFDDLRAYVMADTTNPPRTATDSDPGGGEKPGADLLAALLAKDGIESVQWPVGDDPRRVTLVARLKADATAAAGAASEGPLCLVSHIDVVTSEPARWPKGYGPYEGGVADEKKDVESGKSGGKVLYGRGTLDMKGMGLLETEVMRWLKRKNAKLKRDVVLLAVADEEVNSKGMRDAVENHWDELKCAHSVNEGGMGVRDALFSGQTLYPISVGEKGVVWIRMKAEGPPGHGSTPIDGRAPGKLLAAMDKIAQRKDPPKIDGAIYELLAAAGRDVGGFTGFVLQRPTLVNALAIGKLEGNPVTHAIITNTVNLTGFAGAKQPNVVPSEVYAQYDVRMLPGFTPEQMISELKGIVGDAPGVTFEIMETPMLAAVSSSDDPFYRALAHHAKAVAEAHGDTHVVVGPLLSPGFTDSIFLRAKGTKAYGFVPFIVANDELGGMHGDGEHVSRDNVGRGVETLLRAVVDVAVASP